MLQHVYYLHEQGKRKNMEDSLYPLPGQATVADHVFLVCDGVGGSSKGEEASRIACETIGRLLQQQAGKRLTQEIIEEAIQAALQAMQHYAREHENAAQMSTTLTMAYIQTDGLWIAWCGDSRVYHIRDGAILWRSRDHSLVQQLINTGEITETEAAQHPSKNIIFRSLGAGNARVDPEIHFLADIRAGDYILLCTDGLLEHIDDAKIYDICTGPDPDKATAFLHYCLDVTNDNFSMYLLQLGADSAKPRGFFNKWFQPHGSL